MGCKCDKQKTETIQQITPPIPVPTKTPDQVVAEAIANNKINLLRLALQQKHLLSWLKNGIIGQAKYYLGQKDYSDEDIDKHLATCQGCEFRSGYATSPDIVKSSDKCLGPDPAQGNAPCGCPIHKKIVTGKCPLNKWKSVPLTIGVTSV